MDFRGICLIGSIPNCKWNQQNEKRTAGTMLPQQSSCKWIFAWCHFFNVMQPTEARFCASEILAYTSVVVTFL